MAKAPDRCVWVFNGSRQFPGGVFSSVERAELWIREHRLTGVLTAYPLDEGCFDWALHSGLLSEKIAERQHDAEFIAGFSSASQEHFHYKQGERA